MIATDLVAGGLWAASWAACVLVSLFVLAMFRRLDRRTPRAGNGLSPVRPGTPAHAVLIKDMISRVQSARGRNQQRGTNQ